MSRTERMFQKLDSMSNHDIHVTWDALRDYDPSEYYDEEGGVTMDDWAEAVYSEKGKRGI